MAIVASLENAFGYRSSTYQVLTMQHATPLSNLLSVARNTPSLLALGEI
jgi:hypothetical protein